MEENKQANLDKELQLRVQPSFKFGYTIMPLLIIYGIMFLVSSLMLGLIFSNLIMALIIFSVCFSVVAIILGIQTILNKKQYENIYYDFYKTKIIYRDSFLNVIEKEFNYKYIREIAMRQKFMQRYFNIGDIIIFTNAETGRGGGIAIRNIENVKEIYTQIKNIIEI